MNKSVRTVLFILILLAAACGPAATNAPHTEAPITEEVEPPTEAPLTEEPATEPPTDQPEIPQDHFDGFSSEYQDITLPPEIQENLDSGGRVIPLPADLFQRREELFAFAASVSSDLTPYDLERVVVFTSDQGYTYAAAPIQQEIFRNDFQGDFDRGQRVGIVHDQDGAYGDRPDIYEVWFFNDRAVLLSSQQEIILTTESGRFTWTRQENFKEIPVAIFIQGSCYLCWSLDSRSGCLICL